jgi:myosin-crossreactive antigen
MRLKFNFSDEIPKAEHDDLITDLINKTRFKAGDTSIKGMFEEFVFKSVENGSYWVTVFAMDGHVNFWIKRVMPERL